MSDRAEVLADCATTDEEWAKLRPGMTSWDMSVCVALLASRAKPLADAARDLVAENERLREENAKLVARDQEWWRAACDLFNADEGTPAEAAALGALNALKTGCGWSDVPEPVAKLLCDQRDAALAEKKRLREENGRLREALKPFADEAARRSWMDVTEMRGWNIGGSALTNADLARAAELLAGSPAPA